MSKPNIFVRIFSALWSGADGLRKVLHLLLLLFVFIFAFGVLSGSTPPLLPQQAALLIQPAGALVDQLEGSPYDRALAELMGNAQQQTLVQDVVDALDAAGDDERIVAVHLELSALGSAGLDKLQRIGDALERFRESGKPVIASADYFGQRAYYLGAHADELYMHPEGIVYLAGYGSYRNYFKDAIDLLRIDWNVFRVGSHKSFTEPYTRMDMSPEDRASRERLVEGLWAMYQQDVVAARGLAAGSIQDFADNLITYVEAADGDIAVAARDHGLVDELLSRDELRELLKEYAGPAEDDETTYASVTMENYLLQQRLLHGPRTKSENVAVIVAAGEILNGSQPPGTIGGDSTARLLQRALQDDSVQAVVLRVDSGGGSVFASEVIAQEIEALQAAGKPVVASMGSAAASGGYWISAVADRIIASPSTITGSIGVIGMLPTFQRTLATVGIATDGVGTTPWSGELRPDRSLSDSTKRLFQLIIEDDYRDFVTGVAEHRELDVDYVDSIAQGKVWTGVEALDNGLVDELGGLDRALEVAAELAGLQEGSYGRKLIEVQLTPTEQMVVDILGGAKTLGIDPAVLATPPTPIEMFANQLQSMLAAVMKFNDPAGAYAYCFCEIN